MSVLWKAAGVVLLASAPAVVCAQDAGATGGTQRGFEGQRLGARD